ncbi:MAG TPA: hypothetical protein VGQ17_08215 [Gemmatimonadales bacterium]|jgi:hypothetical protein|nr:hypothetical protein [Gemmatimonadales bacterium]
MRHTPTHAATLLTVLLAACGVEPTVPSAPGVGPLLAAVGVGDHHAILLVSHTGYPGSGQVNVSPTASDPGLTDQGFTVQGEFTLHGADPERTFFIARRVDATPPIFDCTTVAAWNPFIEFLDAVTPTSPPVFRVLTTSAGGAGAAHFYGRFATPLFADGKFFSVRFAILDDTNGSGTPDAGDTEAYVTDACVTVTVK